MKYKFTDLFNSRSKWGQKRRCEMISKFIIKEMAKDDSYNIDHDLLIDTLIRDLKKEIQNRLFHPLSVLRVMDKHGGVLSYEALNLLRKVENKGVKFTKTIIPSPGLLKKYAKIVEKVGDKLCPLERDPKGKCGETITFDQTKLIGLLIKQF